MCAFFLGATHVLLALMWNLYASSSGSQYPTWTLPVCSEEPMQLCRITLLVPQ